MLTEKMVEKLMEKGFKRWTKGTMDRLYINAEYLGLDCDYYKTGNIHAAELNGKHISNSEAYRMKAAKTYIDVATGKLVGTYDPNTEAAQALVEEAEAEIAEEEAKETEAAEAEAKETETVEEETVETESKETEKNEEENKMKIISTVKEGSCEYRAMDGYRFSGKPQWDMEAYRRAYPLSSDHELENRIGRDVDALYDGYNDIYDTNDGLCTARVDYSTKAPLCWIPVEQEETKKSELISEHREELIQESKEAYAHVIRCAGEIEVQLYIWSDGTIDTHESTSGSNSWLVAKDTESRKLYHVVTIRQPFFNWLDCTCETVPDENEDPDGYERAKAECEEWVIDQYNAEEVIDNAISEAETEERA